MKKLSILSVLLLVTIVTFGQKSDDKKFTFNSFVAVGRSTFATNISAPSKFPTLEMRLGAGVVRKLNETFDLRTRLTFGVKFKREGFNNAGVAVVGPPFMELDDLSSDRNHFFYEVPLILQANLKHPSIGFTLGVNYRRFFPNNSDVDALTARGDLGILGGANYRVNEKISIGVDYCVGLTNIIVTSGSVDSNSYTLTAKNNFGQLILEYKF